MILLLKIRIYGSDELMGAQTTSASQPYLSPLNINVLKASWDVTSHFQEGPHAYVVIKNRYCRCIDHGYGDHANIHINSYSDNGNGVFLIKWPNMCHVYNCSFEASWLHSSRQSPPGSQTRARDEYRSKQKGQKQMWRESESDKAQCAPPPHPAV